MKSWIKARDCVEQHPQEYRKNSQDWNGDRQNSQRHRMDRHFHRGVASGCLKPFGKPTSAVLGGAADLGGAGRRLISDRSGALARERVYCLLKGEDHTGLCGCAVNGCQDRLVVGAQARGIVRLN